MSPKLDGSFPAGYRFGNRSGTCTKLNGLVKPFSNPEAAYEDQNEGSYEDALIEARGGFGAGYRAMRKITRALDLAYLIIYQGIEQAPKPRVHFLHRSLLENRRLTAST